MSLYHSIDEIVGQTPLMALSRYARAASAGGLLYAKLECLNPAGSVKDRAALNMLNAAEARGLLSPGATIVEPTSGNTGIGLCAIGVPRGYRVILTMPDTMSVERQALLKAYGATLQLTDGKKGMRGAIEMAEAIAARTPGSFMPSQFTNPDNPAAHAKTTGPEIYRDLGGRVDAFVAGVGTGGTITGVGQYLKSMNPNIRIIAVEPEKSPVLSGGTGGAHGLQGIGAGFVPETLDQSLLDEIIQVAEPDAYRAARSLAIHEGILTGISSGAALHAASELSKRPAFHGKHIVVLLPDTGDRYLSTPLYTDDGR